MKIFRTILLLLGLIFAVVSILEGSRVLLEGPADAQIVLPWLVTYNVVMALLSLPVLYILFREQTRAKQLSILILGCHSLVFLILAGLFLSGDLVALKSVVAMAVRSALWVLLFWQAESRGRDPG